MLTILYLHALLTLADEPTAADSIYGCVRNSMRDSAIQGVRVEIDGGGPAAITGPEGRYSLPVEEAGARQLRFTQTGYRPLAVQITVSPGRSLHLDIDLDPLPTRLPAIEVSASRERPARGDDSGARILDRLSARRYSAEMLRRDPLSAGGDFLLGATGSSAGEPMAGFPSSIHVRGGASDHNQLLLDGVPVYGAMHLGGASSLFNPDAIARIEVQNAVPPTSFGGRLSSSIDVQLRPDTARHVTMTGAASSVWLRQTVEAPLAGGRAAVLVSGERSHRGMLSQDRGIEQGQERNGFHDLLVRGSATLGDDHLDLYLLRSRDHLGFPSVAQPSTGNNSTAPDDAAANQFDWSVNTEALVWRHRAGATTRLDGRVWHAGAGARIDWAATAGAERLANRLDETGARLELLHSEESSHALVGLEIRRPRVSYDVISLGGDTAGAAPDLLQLRSAPTILAAFAEGERRLGERWTVRLGVRANYLPTIGGTLEPRLSVAYRLTPHLAAFVGYGTQHQYLQSVRNEESPLDYAFGADLLVGPGVGGLRPARADQVSATVLADLGPRSTLRIDGYARAFSGIPIVPAATAAPFADRLPPVGSGEARGVDVELTHRAGALDVRANAGMDRTERQSATLEFAPRFQRSAWLLVGAGFRILRTTVVRLGLSTSAGAPTSTLADSLEWQATGGLGQGSEISGSPQAIQGALNGGRLPPYFRLDLGLEREWPVRLAGAAGRLTTSLMVTNLLNRRNALAYVAAPGLPSGRAIVFPSRSVGLRLSWQF
jgi:hypothetical protein